MTLRFTGVFFLLLFSLTPDLLRGREITVRLYSNHPLEELTMRSAGGPLVLKAEGAMVKAGNGTVPVLRLSCPCRWKNTNGETVEMEQALEIRASGGRLQITLRMPAEDYVAAVLAGESGGGPEQALRAMAVAARTYAQRFAGRHRSEGFDFCDSTHCQDVRFSGDHSRVRQAAADTEGELLWHSGSAAATFYSKDCGGMTEAVTSEWPDIRAPYLARHPDPYCVAGGKGGWHAEIRKEELRRALISSGIRAPPRLEGLKVIAHSTSGRVARLRCGGFQVSASSLRFAAGRTLGWNRIRSDLYELREEAERFVFDGRGSGHGVGLCQIGAASMANDGRNYREILAFYYPGTALGLTAQGLRWQKAAGELIDVFTTSQAGDQRLVATADRLAHAAEQRGGRRFSSRPQLRVYPTIAVYRDATGEPGWVAASTRGQVIRLQPAALLQEAILSHELMHVLLPQHPRAPVWLREGVVEALLAEKRSLVKVTQPPPDVLFVQAQSKDQMRAAYAAARACVENLMAAHGESHVLDWLARGPAPSACR